MTKTLKPFLLIFFAIACFGTCTVSYAQENVFQRVDSLEKEANFTAQLKELRTILNHSKRNGNLVVQLKVYEKFISHFSAHTNNTDSTEKYYLKGKNLALDLGHVEYLCKYHLLWASFLVKNTESKKLCRF